VNWTLLGSPTSNFFNTSNFLLHKEPHFPDSFLGDLSALQREFESRGRTLHLDPCTPFHHPGLYFLFPLCPQIIPKIIDLVRFHLHVQCFFALGQVSTKYLVEIDEVLRQSTLWFGFYVVQGFFELILFALRDEATP
jgi:hypothetical protein